MRLQATNPFTHQGRAFAPGDIVQVSASAGKWLIEQGVAVELAEPPKTDKPEKNKG